MISAAESSGEQPINYAERAALLVTFMNNELPHLFRETELTKLEEQALIRNYYSTLLTATYSEVGGDKASRDMLERHLNDYLAYIRDPKHIKVQIAFNRCQERATEMGIFNI